MLTILFCLIAFVAGGLTVIMFSKNNKNGIAKLRQDILNAADKGGAEIRAVLDKNKR